MIQLKYFLIAVTLSLSVSTIAQTINVAALSGAAASDKLNACIAALPEGGVCDATGLMGAQTITGNVNITHPIRFILGPGTYTFSPGAELIIQSIDVEIGGSGQATVFVQDANDTSGKPMIEATAGSDRPYVHALKITGNKKKSGEGTIQIGTPTGNVDAARIEDVQIDNADSTAIALLHTTNAKVMRNIINMPCVHGIIVHYFSSNTWIEDNTVTDSGFCNIYGPAGIGAINPRLQCLPPPSGQLEISCNAAHFNLTVSHNSIIFTGAGTRNGMELDAVYGLKVVDNLVAGGYSKMAGEGISFTANKVLISRNRVSGSQVSCILAFENPFGYFSQTISDNIVSNCQTAIQVAWDPAFPGTVATDIQVTHNTIYNSNLGFQTYSVGNATARASNVIYDNWGHNRATYSLGCCSTGVRVIK